MRYLSLYKTLIDHDTDASNRSIPNISLIIDEKKLILTNENNNDTTFNNVNIIETFDKIPTTPDFTPEPPYNIFPTDTSTRIPVVKIYTDGTDAHNQINKDFYDNAKIWRNNYILNNNLSDPSEPIIVRPDKLYIDENIYPTIYYLYIYSYRIIVKNWNNGLELLTIYPNGLVSDNISNKAIIIFRYNDVGYDATYDTYDGSNYQSYTVTVSEHDVNCFVDTWYDRYISCKIDSISSISDGYSIIHTYINNSIKEELPYMFNVNLGDITEITPVFTTTPTKPTPTKPTPTTPTPTTPTPSTTVAPTNTTTNH